MTDRLFLTPAEAAERLGMRESTLRRKAQRGDIAHHKDGAFLRFTEQNLADYVASTEIPRVNPFQTTRPKRRSA